MKHLFIVNPIAGGSDKTAEVREKLHNAGEIGDNVEVYVTKAPMDAAAKIEAEAASGEELRVYACGGDGTFNECVCGATGRSNVAVCPFPTGTGNDFCRMFGDEKDLFRDVRAVLNGTVRPIDVIDCNGRKSINICSVGFDARVGTGVHRFSKLPILGGATAYVISLIAELFNGLNMKMHIRCGDFSSDTKNALVCACNGRYYGGGFNPSCGAMPDDGLLEIYIVKAVTLIQLASLLGKYAAGKADELPEFITHLRGQEVSIEFEEETVINIDGEALFAKKADIRLLPGAVNLIVPAGLKFFSAANT